jgi:hypothetical protein
VEIVADTAVAVQEAVEVLIAEDIKFQLAEQKTGDSLFFNIFLILSALSTNSRENVIRRTD